MSIAVALHAGRYVLCAADCLEYTFTDDTLTTLAREWRRKKIAHAPIGIVTGTGVCRLIDAVTASRPSEPSELLERILAERATASTWRPALRAHALDSTGFLFTFMAGAQTVAGGVFHPHFDASACLDLLPGRVLAFMRDSSYERYADALERAVRLCGPEDDLEASLRYHAGVLRALIEAYAQEPDRRSSEECSLAVHDEHDRRRVTAILQPGEPLVWTERTGVEDKRLTLVA